MDNLKMIIALTNLEQIIQDIKNGIISLDDSKGMIYLNIKDLKNELEKEK